MIKPVKEGTSLDVMVIGRACLDYISVVKRFPAEDTKAPLLSRFMEGGGQGSSASCCIAKLGGSVAYVGRIGDDEEGDFCLKRLRDFGVETAHVHRMTNGRTPVAYIFVTKDSGKRTIIYEPAHLPPPELDSASLGLLKRAGAVLLDPQATGLAGPLGSVKNRPPVIYDCERSRDGIREMMALADFFIPSSDFLDDAAISLKGRDFNEKVRELDALTRGRLVVTAGENGAFYLDEGVMYRVAPPPVEVKDTTGAGDNFHAAFALGVSRGFDIHECVKFSVAVASLSCRNYGARLGLPTFAEAEKTSRTLRPKPVR
jgi:sulfofructose kinase